MQKRKQISSKKAKKQLDELIREHEYDETDPKYASFKKYEHKPSKYRSRNNRYHKIILWPFIVILPLLTISILLQYIPSNSENHQEPIPENHARIDTHALKEEIAHIFTFMPHPLPRTLQTHILNNVVPFLQELTRVLENSPPPLLQLVDKQHALDSTYVPEGLARLDTYKELVVNKKNLTLTQDTITHLLIMSRAAKKQNIILDLSSTYRSYEYQNTVFNRISESLGTQEALRQSAQPGTSQHQLGTAVDFGTIDETFARTPAGKWLEEHAWKYGFSLSYPQDSESLTGYIYESWHYRYIGIPAAFFEHYYFGSQQYMLEFLHYMPSDSMLRTLDTTALVKTTQTLQ